MMKAPTVAEKRPVSKLVIEMNWGISRLGLTKTRIPVESSFQAFAIRSSSFLTSSRYVSQISFPVSCWTVIGFNDGSDN
jgi:hypothetical protein